MFSARVREGVELRLIEERHADAIFALTDQDRAYLRDWLPWVDRTASVEDTLAFVHRSLEQFAANDGLTAGIWNQACFCGVIGYHKIDWPNRRVEIGYWLGKSFQGQGLATDSCRVLIRHAFLEWELNRVEIRCATGNTGSCAIPKRLGFTLEGTIREGEIVNGRKLDLNIFGLLRSEWRDTE